MAILALQYLENGSLVASLAPSDVRAKLCAAFEQLPISVVIVGWNLPAPLVRACREETTQANVQLLLWHPLLCGDGCLVPRLEWQTVGPGGEPVGGFHGLPEFTFVCPNRPDVRAAVLSHLKELLSGGVYDGVFLDRIRYPSPAADPIRRLACFCGDCHDAAAERGLDLADVRRSLDQWGATPERSRIFVSALLGSKAVEPGDVDVELLNAFLDFRTRSISAIVGAAANVGHGRGLTVALDCFSPALARMVGQDLRALSACGDWTKVMTYAHALGPAGLPFELLGLAKWLITHTGMREVQAIAHVSGATGLPLRPSLDALRSHGLPSTALRAEIKHALAAGVGRLLAGIELVELEGVAELDAAQIEADLRALYTIGVEGLVLSWDLWHIPLQRLRLVHAVWRQ